MSERGPDETPDVFERIVREVARSTGVDCDDIRRVFERLNSEWAIDNE